MEYVNEPVTQEQKDKALEIKLKVAELVTLLSSYASREASIAITNLETGSMWAVKAVTK